MSTSGLHLSIQAALQKNIHLTIRCNWSPKGHALSVLWSWLYILLYQIIWYVLLKFRLSRIVNNARFLTGFYAVTSFNSYFWVGDFMNLECIWQKFSAYLKVLSKYRRMVFFVFKSLVLFKRYWCFSIMQIRWVMMS